MANEVARRLAKWGFLSLAVAGAGGFAYDSFVRLPASRQAAADILNPVKVSTSAHCSGLGFLAAGPTMAMAKLPWLKSLLAAAPPTPTASGSDVPLWPGLGNYSYKITTSKPQAQAYFDQGLRLSYGFNHYEAVRAYKKAQEIDPECAMCFWGEAYALGPNLNLPMLEDAVAPAFAAIAQAQLLAPNAGPVEQALIGAMAKRYAAKQPADRAPLDKAFADAMAAAAAKFPGDADVLTVYADAMMNLSPWDYWEPGGVKPHDQQKALEPTLVSALKIDPKHPGALHLYIHAVEATPHPERATKAADTLLPLMPAAGHMVHMPAHIYARTGRFADSIKANQEAIVADEAYFKAVPERPSFDMFRVGYYPHNVHFVVISAMLAGDFDTMRPAAKKLATLIPEDAQRAAIPTQAIAGAPLATLAHMGDDKDVMATPKPADDLPYMQMIWHYARGLCLVRAANIKDAQAELTAIEALSSSGALFKIPQAQLPAEILGDIAANVLRARIAQAKGDTKAAIKYFRAAAEDQTQVPYTEPPFWYYPVAQSLGGLLLDSGNAQEAVDVFRASLLDQPGNAWALYGLAKAYDKLGDKAAAKETNKHFEAAWLGRKPAFVDPSHM